MEDVLADGLTNKNNVQVRSQISAAVTKQIVDQEEMQGQALVEMIKDTSLDGNGKIVNRLV